MTTEKAQLNIRVDNSIKSELESLHSLYQQQNNMKVSFNSFIVHILKEYSNSSDLWPEFEDK